MYRLPFLLFFLCSTLNCFPQLEAIVDEHYGEFSESPGAIVAIYKDGEISFSKSYGMANLDFEIPIQAKTVFDIGSISKQFTASCIFLLEQQGKLSIEDPIQKFLPEMPVYDGDSVRIRHLINHTSGLRDYVEIMAYAGIPFSNTFTEDMGLDIMSRQSEPNFKAGERLMYNNGGYLLLAVIIRRASGMSIGEFAASHIFEPLGMKNTFILENPNRVIKNGATAYTRLPNGSIEELHYRNFAIGGDGQIYTTTEDLLLWDRNFYEPKLGGTQLLDRLHQRGILNNGDTTTYAGGLFIEEYKDFRLVHHTGSWGGFVAAFYRFPELRRSMLILSNYRATGSLKRIYAILDGLLPSQQSSSKQTEREELGRYQPSLETLEKYEGLFEGKTEPHKRFRTYVENDSLKVHLFWKKQSAALIPIAQGEFQHASISYMKFDFNQADHAPVIHEPLGKLSSQRTQPFEALDDVAPYAGIYYSKEVGVSYTISAEGKQLSVKRGEEDLYLLDQLSPDVFGKNNLGFQFKRVDGEPESFLLHDRRIRNLLFRKIK